ncbi:MAG TPA: hypothetical protein VFY40_07250 [Blastocatellia bacterium]|nr:hypothetical protein [Blastocatellia bacterium]
MPVVTCKERTKDDPDAQDVGWASNATEDQLYYPYVSSCVTVTLVFEKGLLGGHASQVTPDNKRQPDINLTDVINRMIDAAPDQSERGAFLKIYFYGTTDDGGWKLSEAENLIAAKFGQPGGKTKYFGLTPVDIVFDTKSSKLFSVSRDKDVAKGAAQTIKDSKEFDTDASYL